MLVGRHGNDVSLKDLMGSKTFWEEGVVEGACVLLWIYFLNQSMAGLP